MSEVTFAKQFLATLDKRPIKLSADHVSDPKKYPNQSPFVLPKQVHPFPKKTSSGEDQSAQTQNVTVTIKPMRSGETITISDLDLDSTIHDVKTKYAQQTSLAAEKIKLMYNKKPAADLKTLKELGAQGTSVELSAMILGGTATAASTSALASPSTEKGDPATSIPTQSDAMDIDPQASGPNSEAAQAAATVESTGTGEATGQILQTEAFWTDLSGFLVQRLRDDAEGRRLANVFREAYTKL